MNLVSRIAVPFAALIAVVVAPLTASAQDLGVVVNGTALVFDQPPLDRGGRVYVPLRGLFERLGASVVFDAGRIAMTAGTHTIALKVGETTGTIDGQPQTLEAPPIVVGGRTLVPLRFIAQALGAKVAYDGSTRIVSIDAAPIVAASGATPAASASASASPVAAAPVVSVPPSAPLAKGEIPIELRLLRVEPAPMSTIARKRPELSATFAETVDASTVRIALDGRDVSADSFTSARGFVADPGADLAPGPHTVTVLGRTPANERFEERWTFTTADAPNANYLSGLEPASGTTLGSAATGSVAFDVSGFTRPKARVRIVATTSGSSPAFSDASESSQTIDVAATAKGYFEAPLMLADHGSGLVDVRITSTAPGGGVAVRTLRLRL